MSPDTKNVCRGYTFSLLLVIVFAFLAATARAGGPSKADLQNLADIKKNQEAIADCRKEHDTLKQHVQNALAINAEFVDCYNLFLQAKQWNKAEVAELNRNGWNVDWSSMTLVPLSKPLKAAYRWDGAEGYKNDVLALYQQKLARKGITDPETVKLLLAQLIQENGTLNPERLGDWECSNLEKAHCSFGIIQYNAWARHRMSAESFLTQNPEWKTVEKQLTWMVDAVSWRLDNYPLELAIVAHNHPAAAKRGTVTKYYHDVAGRLSLLTL